MMELWMMKIVCIAYTTLPALTSFTCSHSQTVQAWQGATTDVGNCNTALENSGSPGIGIAHQWRCSSGHLPCCLRAVPHTVAESGLHMHVSRGGLPCSVRAHPFPLRTPVLVASLKRGVGCCN